MPSPRGIFQWGYRVVLGALGPPNAEPVPSVPSSTFPLPLVSREAEPEASGHQGFHLVLPVLRVPASDVTTAVPGSHEDSKLC